MIDAEGAIARMEAAIARVDRRRDPQEHATLAYRLGLAHAESPTGDPTTNARNALRWYEIALDGFDARYEPIAHGRVLNAAGAVRRALRDPEGAARLFEQAAELFDGRARPDETGAARNNLGLARLDAGDAEGAVEAFREALASFDPAGEEGRRGRAAALINQGMAAAACGTDAGRRLAAECHERALAEIADDDAPYHAALAWHSLGLARMGLAESERSVQADHARAAIEAFRRSLEFFTRTGFPYQHSLAQHNLARALLAAGGHRNAQLALVAVEDCLGILDPRLHDAEWRRAHSTLEETERELSEIVPGRSRRQHFVDLLGASTPDERIDLLRQRLTRLLALPPDARHTALRELARAGAAAPDGGLAQITAELSVLMELPNEHLEAALVARLAAHAELSGEARQAADGALDRAVGEALNGPQRVLVRDFLSASGFERP